MATEIVEFLMAKFVDGLGEEDHATIPFYFHFQEIREDLDKKIRSCLLLGTADSLRESLYIVNDILTECQMLSKKKKRYGLFRPFHLHESWFFYRMWKRLLMTKQKIRSIGGRPEPYSPDGDDHVSVSAVDLIDRWTTPAVDFSKDVDEYLRDHEEKEVVRLVTKLGEGNYNAFGIIGMGGVGKTRLAQMIFNSPQVRTQFFPKLWVCLSQTISKGKDMRREILERMLMSLIMQKTALQSLIVILQFTSLSLIKL